MHNLYAKAINFELLLSLCRSGELSGIESVNLPVYAPHASRPDSSLSNGISARKSPPCMMLLYYGVTGTHLECLQHTGRTGRQCARKYQLLVSMRLMKVGNKKVMPSLLGT